eukprot:Clim_evm59s108 gene=Clim_evmTU59s108
MSGIASRFYAASSSGSEDEQSDDESFEQQVPAGRSRFLASDSESEDEERVVKSKKDKRFEELAELGRNIRNHKNIKDWNAAQSDYDAMEKALKKTKGIVGGGATPKIFLKYLIELDEAVEQAAADKEGRKKMSKTSVKALNALRQKLRKAVRAYEGEIELYKKDPLVSGESDDEDEDEDEDESETESEEEESEDEAPKAATKAPASRFLRAAAGGDSDSETDSDESSDDDDDQVAPSSKWLKASSDSKKKSKAPKEKKTKVSKGPIEGIDSVITTNDFTTVQAPTSKGAKSKDLFEGEKDITVEVVQNKILDVLAQRGRRGTDRAEQVTLFKKIREVARENKLGLGIDLKILLHLISAQFDLTPATATHMDLEHWNTCYEFIMELIRELEDHPEIRMGEDFSEEEEILEPEDGKYMIRGSPISLVERLDDEFTRSLQNLDPHTTAYVDRLKDDQRLIEMIIHMEKILVAYGNNANICRIYLRHLEHVYYRVDKDLLQQTDFSAPSAGRSIQTGIHGYVEADVHAESLELVTKLATYLYRYDDTGRLRTKAMLYHIYFLALHNFWHKSRDLLLMSHLQDAVVNLDIPAQIIYNRTIVQVGLCAFRTGHIREAHQALHDVIVSNRFRELLAQGTASQRFRDQERNREQEKVEKRRQMPFHMHINLELLECVYHCCVLLLEIPPMASGLHGDRRRMISRPFRRLLDIFEKQPFNGPPENTKEHVVAAARALMQGEWRKTQDLVLNLKIWNLMPDHENVKKMLARKIQEEGLRTYLFAYSGVYETLRLEVLAEMFELPTNVAYSIISKMMINNELSASWDQPSQSIVLHRAEATKLQFLTYQAAEKAMDILVYNEQMLERQSMGAFSFRGRGRGGRGDGEGFQFRKREGGNFRGRGGRGGRGGRRGGLGLFRTIEPPSQRRIAQRVGY